MLPLPRTIDRNHHLLVALLAIFAIAITGLAPASAAAATCGSDQVKRHTSSWGFKELYFHSKGCITATSTTVAGSGVFWIAGNGGTSTYRMRVTITDVTNGRTLSSTKFTSWGEGDVSNTDWLCLLGQVSTKTTSPTDVTSCVSGRDLNLATLKLPRIAGHTYRVAAWDQSDMLNDGKGLFTDPVSSTSWTA